MLLKTIVYDEGEDIIIEELNEIVEYFEAKDVSLGISEAIDKGIHFVKVFCDDNDYSEKLANKFNFYIANILYRIVVKRYYDDEVHNFLNEDYFFLKYEDMQEISNRSYKILNDEDRKIDDERIYCLNKKNDIMDKIQECIEENEEINLKGFITFRIREFKEDLESAVNKVAEKYMVEKEYDEFIKLLKYFVGVQESKIDEINIIIKKNGEYIIRDDKNKDIMSEMLSELTDTKYNGSVSTEDLIISGLITYAPEKIIIHHVDNCINKEIIETIKKVFEDRVEFCDKCSKCSRIRNTLKV